MSYNILNENEYLVEGIQMITALYPNYNPDTLFDCENNIYYNLNMLENSILNIINYIPFDFYKMLIFDFIIGNSDRHHSNWAFVKNNTGELKYAPLYDNGSSLCSYIDEHSIEQYLGNDEMKFNSLVNTKSKSIIRIDGKIRKKPNQIEIIQYLKNLNNSDIINYVNQICNILSADCISNLINELDDEIISSKRKCLLIKYLNRKIEILKEVFRKEDL